MKKHFRSVLIDLNFLVSPLNPNIRHFLSGFKFMYGSEKYYYLILQILQIIQILENQSLP